MILLISDRPHLSREMAHSLLEGGIYLFCASFENAVFMARTKDIGGVILDGVPHPKAASALAGLLRSKYPDMPMALVLTPSLRQMEEQLCFPVECILREADPAALSAKMLAFCRRIGWSAEGLQSFELSIGTSPSEVVYMGYPFPLARREYALLRCLFYRSPDLTPADDLMSLCYPKERKSISNITLLVHNINQHALKIDPRPLIVNVYGKGYRLRDGILGK